MVVERIVLAGVVMACGCTQGPEVDLSAGGLSANGTAHASDGSIGLELTRLAGNPPHDAAKPTDCVQLSSSTTYTVNGMRGSVVNLGSFQGSSLGATGYCVSPEFSITLDPLPADLDIALADGTATLHIQASADATGHYPVTRCDFAQCFVSTL